MFGLWYAILGLLSGITCSYLAKNKNRIQKVWYMIGQVFPVLSVVLILFLDQSENDYNYSDSDDLGYDTNTHSSLIIQDKV